MSSPLVSCTNCKAPLPEDVFNWHALTPCPACQSPLQVEIFPALFRATTPGRAGEAIVEATESSCFYHPAKKAVVPCEACGRFLCGLCDCEFNGSHFCPSCLETGRTKGKIKSMENHRTLWDSTALSLAILPMLIFWFSVVTAPLALFIAIRHWNTPTSIIHRTKIRFVLAIIFASLEILGWIVGIYWISTRRS